MLYRYNNLGRKLMGDFTILELKLGALLGYPWV